MQVLPCKWIHIQITQPTMVHFLSLYRTKKHAPPCNQISRKQILKQHKAIKHCFWTRKDYTKPWEWKMWHLGLTCSKLGCSRFRATAWRISCMQKWFYPSTKKWKTENYKLYHNICSNGEIHYYAYWQTVRH